MLRGTASDKLLRYKAFNIAKNQKYDRYWLRLALMVYKYSDKNFFGGAIIQNQQLAEELHK